MFAPTPSVELTDSHFRQARDAPAWEASRATEQQRALCDRFAEAFETFGRRQWAKATQQFEGILHDFPNDGPTLFHLSRYQQYQAESADVEDPSVVLMNAK